VRAIGVFIWFDRGVKRDSEDIPLINTLDDKATEGMTDEHVEQVSHEDLFLQTVDR